jgi:hypothetical protein
MKIDDFKVSVRVVGKAKKSTGKVLGVAMIEYHDPIKDGFRLTGFKILRGDYKTDYIDSNKNFLWLAPPAYQDPVTGKLVNMFFVYLEFWKALEKKVLTQYLEKEIDF